MCFTRDLHICGSRRVVNTRPASNRAGSAISRSPTRANSVMPVSNRDTDNRGFWLVAL